MAENEYFQVRFPKRIVLYIYVVLCIAVVVIAYNNWPRYIVLDIPAPANGFIIHEEKMIYNPQSTGDVLNSHNTWIWKQEYGFLPSDLDLLTPASALAYFDTWLINRGWKRFEGGGSPCDLMAKVGAITPDEQPLAYTSDNTTGSYYSSAVCLATHPYTSIEGNTGFVVVLFTATK